MALGVGIVGSGFMGRTWAHVASASPALEVRAVAGGRRAESLACDFSIALESSVESLVGRTDLDLVVITSPPAAHCEQTEVAARAGKHVLVEKPMAHHPAAARTMADAATRAGIKLGVVSQHRFRQLPRLAKDLIDAGELGTIRMVRVTGVAQWWDTTRSQDAWKRDSAQMNPFVDWGSHACDLLRWLVNSEPASASAQSDSFSGTEPIDQSLMALYRFRSGVLASLLMSYEVPTSLWESPLQFVIVGSRATFEFGSYSSLRRWAGDQETVVATQAPFDAADPADEVRLEAYRGQLDDFVSSITNDHQPAVSGQDGTLTQDMLFATLDAAHTGMSVQL